MRSIKEYNSYKAAFFILSFLLKMERNGNEIIFTLLNLFISSISTLFFSFRSTTPNNTHVF